MTTLEEYKELLIPAPNNIQPKFMAWVEAQLKLYTDAQTFLDDILNAFDIETAVGAQLDIIGERLGRSRVLDFEPSYDEQELTDDDYRLILKAKIIQNLWKGTRQEIYDFWQEYFPDNPIVVIDNGDMSISFITAGLTPLQQELVENYYYFPKPAGVRINFEFTAEDHPYFAYNRDTDTLKGYNEGYWFPTA